MPNFDSQLENSIDRIHSRLSGAEAEYFLIAGKRLSKIFSMSNEHLKNYLYSAEYLNDTNSDINKVKRLLNKAHRENLKDMKLLARELINESYKEGVQIAEAKQNIV